MIDDRRIRVNELIKELRAEIKENHKELKKHVKRGNYNMASHLISVNECLDYVISRMTSGSTALV